MKYINFSQLRSFHAVSKTGSITQASKLLSVSQPTITKQIQLLEDFYSINLINTNPSLARSGVSFGWLSSALHSCYKTTLSAGFLKAIKPPVIILAGSNDKLISIKAIKKALGFLQNGQLIFFNESRHELYIELPYVIEQVKNCTIGFIRNTSR